MLKRWLIVVLSLLLMSVCVLADQTQLYSKIYLNPYYLGSTSNGVLYNYTLSVNPPDGLTQVYSATITFQAYISPSVNFTLLVNNKSCNNPNYYVSTTYATSGQGVASFDCSNVINKSGNYSLSLKMDKNTGAINGWLDLTYTNKKKSVVALSGTEYQVGDAVKTFLQLSEDNIPITNATCQVNIYYPNNTLWQTNQSLVYQNGSNGLYFWQGVAPNVTGVYMVDAVCQYFYGILWAFPSGSTVYPIPTTTVGSLTGTGLTLNSYQDDAEMTSGATGGKTDSYFNFNTTDMNLTNTSGVLYWMGQSLGTQTPTLSVQVYNWTSGTWKLLPNSVTLSGTGQSFATGQNDQLLTNTFELGGMINATTHVIRIRVNSTGTATHSIFQNWLSIAFLRPTTQFLDNVMGGGEVHISNLGATQTGLIQSVLDYLTNTIYPYLTQIWNKLLGIETQLNTTINLTNQTLQIANATKNDTSTIITNINNLNTSMQQGFAEKDAHIQSAYDNMSLQVADLKQNTTQNFNLTWQMIQALNQSTENSQILSYLQNITLAVAATQTQIANVNQSINDNINTINQSLSGQIANNSALIISVNSSTQSRFDELQSLLQNLSVQISNNQNITQANISALMAECAELNISISGYYLNLNQTLAEMNSSIAGISNITNETLIEVEEIEIILNATSNDLRLMVNTTNRCLVDTNWIARAYVTDTYGNTMSPTDGVSCNMTTDLWGTSAMSFDYVQAAYKYIHVCDPDYTTFNWSVSCAR